MEQDLSVNDGKGLFDSDGLIDTLIVDCHSAVKDLVSGSYIGFCAKIVEMIQKLNRLKKGIKEDKESLEKQIRELREMLDDINGKE